MRMSRRIVDFPAPLGPVRNANSPLFTRKVTSLSATPVRGYSFVTRVKRIISGSPA